MVKIISDSSTLLTKEEAEKLGVSLTYLLVTIKQKSYKELLEISRESFIEKIREGNIPTTSQPSIGEKMELYEHFSEEIIDLSLADGLSGTYVSACSARSSVANPERIHVVNTKTLCGPHRYLVEKAANLAKQGCNATEIIDVLQKSIEDSVSFLIPNDFSFLKRGGRLTPLAATLGGMLKIVPIMTLTQDCKKLEKFATQRTYKSALEKMKAAFIEQGVNENYKFYITHCENLPRVQETVSFMQNAFPNTEIEVLELGPAFITQGGPGCVAIQSVLK